MKFPQELPDIRDEMQKLIFEFLPLLDPRNPRDIPALARIAERVARLAGALNEAIVDQTRMRRDT
ncbi:hypothetical protein IIA15_10165 [candidate division TA06 bacterium]|nr:hypothetical protein [candidate division TA06 bacterium]